MKAKEIVIWLHLLVLAAFWWCLPAGYLGRYLGWTGWTPAWTGWAPAAVLGWLLACRLICLWLFWHQPDQPEPDAAAIVIEPPPVRCPQCRSTNLKIYHTIQTDPVQRYRVCRDCGYKFKTIASR